ncbi:Spo0E like sporulation regulatory protein [Caloramator mitchellensis]|uniref:Spo0E like sporulation regulatory protein n=1 Tax=Caloramator mitchellensis TaxID=908809 RepID=A0A0R3JRX8_CALMK|nr:aspartyl-phosphate phosphatase Spo0E family protein [Caloramator mitchellensis]KRQ86225.1 Spo0E like sporulation regulatory protein [Caloramator mitchellensis]
MTILREKIENLRKIMDKKLEEKNFLVDDEVVRISQKLDKLIVLYELLLKGKRG